MTIDDSIAIFGRFNYTGPANKTNDENILILGDLDEIDSTAKKIQRRIAKGARIEIERIAKKFGDDIQ